MGSCAALGSIAPRTPVCIAGRPWTEWSVASSHPYRSERAPKSPPSRLPQRRAQRSVSAASLDRRETPNDGFALRRERQATSSAASNRGFRPAPGSYEPTPGALASRSMKAHRWPSGSVTHSSLTPKGRVLG